MAFNSGFPWCLRVPQWTLPNQPWFLGIKPRKGCQINLPKGQRIPSVRKKEGIPGQELRLRKFPKLKKEPKEPMVN